MKHRAESIKIINNDTTNYSNTVRVFVKCYDGSEAIFNYVSYEDYLRTKMILEQNTANIYIA